MARIKYRLGLDLGATSLGWCVYLLDNEDEPISIVRMGVRLFPDGRDPKSLASKAADRRAARQARRRRDRLLKRRARMMDGLVRFGLMPPDPAGRKELQSLDPYELRRKGLDGPLRPYELGRALYHIARKRGFRSSRKERSQDERETGQVKASIAALRSRIHERGCRTVGEYLAIEHAERKPVRGRRRADGSYILYLQRDMVADEFDALWQAQKAYHPDLLTEVARDYLRDTLVFQRPLIPVQPGFCLFEETEPRARLSSPLQQQFRILQELNNLRLINQRETRALTLDERDTLAEYLRHNIKASFATLRGLLGLRRNDPTRFNLEQENRRDLKGDVVGAQFSRPDCLGAEWYAWPASRQEALAELVATAEDTERLIEQLVSPPWSLAPAVSHALAKCNLPDEFGSLSLKALGRIVPELKRDVITYDVAVKRAGYSHHSQLHTGEIFDSLPYYGQVLRSYTSPTPRATNPSEQQYGKISNPTVHIGLNQLRQLVNALSRRYGPPHQVVIELAREFALGGERRRELEKTQRENYERNRRYDETLVKLGQIANRENRQRLQLWEELARDDALNRRCIYSGRQLSISSLFSPEVEIDHILPFSKSLHDGIGNKLLCFRQANREKGNRTPFEAFGHSPAGYNWEDILSRAGTLPRNKAALFQEDALQKFLGDRDFLDRHLNDTAYISRVARQYLSYICHKDNVWVSTGKLTSMIRGKFRLNELLSKDGRKNRDDHRHHALDAAVIGLCSRSLIQRISTAAEQAERHGEQRLLEGLQLPWQDFKEELGYRLAGITPSYKPDHGREAALHNDTNYGLRGRYGEGQPTLVAHRISILDITPNQVESIPDANLKQKLKAILEEPGTAKDRRVALERFSEDTGIRRIQVLESLSVIPINDRRSGVPYRYVKGDGNYCYEIFETGGGRWDGFVISSYSANCKNFSERKNKTQDGRPLRLRIRKNDLLVTEEADRKRILRVAKFSEGMIFLVDAHEANADARIRSKEGGLRYVIKSPNSLRALKARTVGVDVLGYINDPGFKE